MGEITMKHKSDQFELPGLQEAFNLAGETYTIPEPPPGDRASWIGEPSPINRTGQTLEITSDYRESGYGIETIRLLRCELDDDLATYFVALNGDCFGLISLDGQSCIATVEKGLGLATKGVARRYVTFALKKKTASAIKAWREKWTKRTTGPIDYFDASVTG
jgi:hypothetical protein